MSVSEFGVLILIDGYNVLKGVTRGGDVSDKDRDQFVAQLGAYACRKKHKVTVVFDGGMYGWADKEVRGSVIVIFTGARETADDVIRKQLKKHRLHDVLLVSSDRELNYNASRYEIPSIDSEDFYLLMQMALEWQDDVEGVTGGCEVVKTATESSPELDKLMQEASITVQHKCEDQLYRQTSTPNETHGLSRMERRLLEKLKKL